MRTLSNSHAWTWLGVAVIAAATALPAAAQEEKDDRAGAVRGDEVVTAGEGIVKVVPDQAFVTIAAESRAKTPRDAQRQNAEAMSAVQQKLRAAGLPDEAIRTVGYDLQPEFDWNEGRQRLRGYVARNSIEVRVDRIERVGEIVDIAVGSGATSVSGVRFDLRDRAKVEREALRKAVEDARARAEALATAAGRGLERVVRIEESGSPVVPFPRPEFRAAMASDAAAQTPVTPGQMEIKATVRMTARLR